MNIIFETLKNPKGKWSRKSLTAFASFGFAIVYEFVFPFFNFQTKEYVFISLLALSGSVLGLTVWDKNKKP